MFQLISLTVRWVRRFARRRVPGCAGVEVNRWLHALSAPVQVGVLLQHEGWHAVLHEPGVSRGASTYPSPTPSAWAAAQTRAWSPDTGAERVNLQPGLSLGPSQAAQLAAWSRALQSLHNLLPTGACHLTLSWPDELLWSSAITLSGPLAEAELSSVLEQELSVLLPVPLDQVAWAVRPLAQSAEQPLALGRWPSLLAWLRLRLGIGRVHPLAASRLNDHDVVWQCWAIPRALAHHIGAVGRQLGWASVGIEPCSVSVQRAEAMVSRQADTMSTDDSAGVSSPEVLAAWGAALRQPSHAPDLLRYHRGGWWARCSIHARGGWLGLLAWGLTAGAGYALGGVYHERWSREQEAWTQRLRQLHATQQAQQMSRQAHDQARLRQQEQQARVAHNQRFAQVLQAWASTVPEGVRWQQLSLRPRLLELQGQALGAERVTRWMDRWPQALLTGGQQHVHWQPEAPGLQSTQLPSVWGVRVQVSWSPMQKVPE